jgi:hypothetical protein
MLTLPRMKILKSEKVSPFGGLNFVLEELDRLKIEKELSTFLPVLPAQSSYTWRDILYSFWSVFLCGGDCIEDLSEHFSSRFSNPTLKIPSPDTVLKRFTELAVATELIKTPRGVKTHELNVQSELNKLNIKLVNKLGLLPDKDLTLDFDNTIIYTGKADAKMTYTKEFGYNPGVGLIDGNVVFVENRNGNTSSQILQEKSLSDAFTLLEEQQVKVSRFRADAAFFKFETLQVVNKYVDKFYVRPRMNEAVARAISKVKDWQPIDRNIVDPEFLGEVLFTPFIRTAERLEYPVELPEYRLIVIKQKRFDGQVNLFTQEAFGYRCILTSDFEMTAREVVDFYGKRGAAEREFDVLKNDFGWQNLPFSKLEQNTVFLLFTAICKNIYTYLIRLFSSKSESLKPTFRIKKFIFRFICIPAKWVRKARSWHLRLFGELCFKT